MESDGGERKCHFETSVHGQDGEGCERQSEMANTDEEPKSLYGEKELMMMTTCK